MDMNEEMELSSEDLKRLRRTIDFLLMAAVGCAFAAGMFLALSIAGIFVK